MADDAPLPEPRRGAVAADAAWSFAIATILMFGLLTGVIAIGGHPVGPALSALWNGSFGSAYALTSATLVRTTPLLLTGLAVALAFRAGVWNIGAEGQLLVGATAAVAVGLSVGAVIGAWALVVALAAGAAAGALWAGIAAWLRQRFGVLEVISTIMLNFIAAYLVGYLVRGPLQEPSRIYPQTSALTAAARMPRVFAASRLHWGLLLALAAAPLLWWILRQTAVGFRIRAAGANPDAAHVAGTIDVTTVRRRAFLASGALAGLAGAIELTGVTFALYENLSPGYGFTAIAVALLARLHPLLVVLTALLFGGLESGALAMQRDAGIPAVTVFIVEGGLILLALAGNAGGARGAGGWLRRRADDGHSGR